MIVATLGWDHDGHERFPRRRRRQLWPCPGVPGRFVSGVIDWQRTAWVFGKAQVADPCSPQMRSCSSPVHSSDATYRR